MLSIIIPSRNEKFMEKTVEDIFNKAKGEVEVIVVLDGYWATPKDNPRLTLLHRSESRGMRNGISSGVAIAKGEYIMKLDAHCMLDEGFDLKLVENCEDNWVCVPRRKRLDPENWCLTDTNKADIDYEFLSCPKDADDWGGKSLHGKVWDERNRDSSLKSKLIDDLMSFQGSCWMMKRDYFYKLDLMDEDNYGPFWNEAQEIGLKSWLSGGRVIVNKNTWYAHLHKGKKYGRGYFMNQKWLDQGAGYTLKWMQFKGAWDKQTLPLSYLIEKFWQVPTWTQQDLDKLKQNGN